MTNVIVTIRGAIHNLNKVALRYGDQVERIVHPLALVETTTDNVDLICLKEVGDTLVWRQYHVNKMDNVVVCDDTFIVPSDHQSADSSRYKSILAEVA